MKMLKYFLTKNDAYKNGDMKPQGIMVHSTGANNPNISRYVPIGTSPNHWDRPGIKKCVHAFIGLDTDGVVNACQTLPWTKKAWHSGPPSIKGKVSANNTHIGFECCEDGLNNDDYFRQVYNKAVELCAYLCKEFNLDPLKDGVIISHHEGHLRGIASNHADIDHWLKRNLKTMDDFRQCVADKMMEGGEDVNDYDKWKENMERYKQEQANLAYSNWAADNEVPKRIAERGLSDGTRPRSAATREEVFMLLINLESRILKLFGKE